MYRPPTASLVTALAGAVLVAGCGSSSTRRRLQDPARPGRSTPPRRAAWCTSPKSPTAAYKGGAGATTTEELTFLAYYTANGNKKFCDGKPANAKDKAWAALYVTLDTPAAAKNVKGITG